MITSGKEKITIVKPDSIPIFEVASASEFYDMLRRPDRENLNRVVNYLKSNNAAAYLYGRPVDKMNFGEGEYDLLTILAATNPDNLDLLRAQFMGFTQSDRKPFNYAGHDFQVRDISEKAELVLPIKPEQVRVYEISALSHTEEAPIDVALTTEGILEKYLI